MDKQERKTVTAVLMEISDMAERLNALHEYLTDSLYSERKTDAESPNNTVTTGK